MLLVNDVMEAYIQSLAQRIADRIKATIPPSGQLQLLSVELQQHGSAVNILVDKIKILQADGCRQI